LDNPHASGGLVIHGGGKLKETPDDYPALLQYFKKQITWK
jgi:hypothetical protein